MMEPPVRSEFVAVDNLCIRYLAAGEAGSPVVLLHGGGLDSAALTYRHSLGPLGERHRVFAPDLPGFGKSDSPEAGYSTDYFIAFVGRFLDALGLERASLVGLSLGGGTALGFALARPERVEKLVLVDSYGLGSAVPVPLLSYLLVRLPFVNELTWAALARSRAGIKWTLRSVARNPAAVDDALVDEVQALLRQPGAGRAWRAFQRQELTSSGLRTDYTGRLHELRAPTLILHGGADSLVPVAWARRAHHLIAGSELQIFPEAGHWLPRDDPEGFNWAVLNFLARP